LIKKNYSGMGDFIDIKAEPNEELKIVGFKHNEIKIEISKIIDKAKYYNFPDFWEDTVELLTSHEEEIMVKDVAQGSNEWKRLEANFKLTMPQAYIQSIQRIQNKNVWKKYHNEYKALGIKYGGKEHATEAEMYHGTR
jgi:hypothetical protein